ncbi:MAG: ATP-binding cassette domain-containing protein [bacterium]|nr:ATP-binding cassette domain-containing protein [bacterium]
MTGEDAARLEQVTRLYRGAARAALGPLSLALAPGSWTALVGHSGSGKTTLLNLLAGLDRADTGSVWLFGRDVTDASEAALTEVRRSRIGIVHQESRFLEHLPVWQNVTCRLVPRGVSRALRRDRAHAALESVDVAESLDRLPHALSGGERQRVAFARATIDDPQLLLLDEPTSNVDEDTAAHVIELLRARHSSGTTVVVATHDAALAAAAQDRWRLEAGLLSPAT